METKASIGMIYVIAEWMTRYLVVNILWFIFNLPVVFLLVNLLVAKSTSDLIAISLGVLMMLPFIFFPATTSLFALIRKWHNGEEFPMIRMYLKCYKENYVRSMMSGFVIGAIWLILIVDYYVFTMYVGQVFQYFFIPIFLLLLTFTLHCMSSIVHFETSFFRLFKNAFYMTIGSPVISVGLSVGTAFIVYSSFNYATFLIPLYMGALIAFLSFSMFHKVFLQVER